MNLMKNYEKILTEKTQSFQSINDEKITSMTFNSEASNSKSKSEKIKFKKKNLEKILKSIK